MPRLKIQSLRILAVVSLLFAAGASASTEDRAARFRPASAANQCHLV
jgi:hypothetical protein